MLEKSQKLLRLRTRQKAEPKRDYRNLMVKQKMRILQLVDSSCSFQNKMRLNKVLARVVKRSKKLTLRPMISYMYKISK